MENIDKYYKDWSGVDHITNSCHPVHDSSESCDFAIYFAKEILNELLNKKVISANVIVTYDKTRPIYCIPKHEILKLINTL